MAESAEIVVEKIEVGRLIGMKGATRKEIEAKFQVQIYVILNGKYFFCYFLVELERFEVCNGKEMNGKVPVSIYGPTKESVKNAEVYMTEFINDRRRASGALRRGYK